MKRAATLRLGEGAIPAEASLACQYEVTSGAIFLVGNGIQSLSVLPDWLSLQSTSLVFFGRESMFHSQRFDTAYHPYSKVPRCSRVFNGNRVRANRGSVESGVSFKCFPCSKQLSGVAMHVTFFRQLQRREASSIALPDTTHANFNHISHPPSGCIIAKVHVISAPPLAPAPAHARASDLQASKPWNRCTSPSTSIAHTPSSPSPPPPSPPPPQREGLRLLSSLSPPSAPTEPALDSCTCSVWCLLLSPRLAGPRTANA